MGEKWFQRLGKPLDVQGRISRNYDRSLTTCQYYSGVPYYNYTIKEPETLF